MANTLKLCEAMLRLNIEVPEVAEEECKIDVVTCLQMEGSLRDSDEMGVHRHQNKGVA